MAIINLDQRVSKPKDTSMLYSSYQTDIFRAITETDENILIEAKAGSGKTTTILHALELLPADKSAIFVAFNRSIADELALKVPPHVEARTLHSVGYEVMRNNYKTVISKSNKVMNLLKFEVLDCKTNSQHRDWAFTYGRDICTLMSRFKSGLITDVTREDVDQLIDSCDLELETTPFWMGVYQQLLTKSYEFTGEKGACVIDFDDMLALPVYYNCTFPQYDYVFVDEAQDLNHIQRLLISRLLKENGRLVAVGDTHQAIYGFRGASHNSMRLIENHYNCKEYPLSISYRCDTNIVKKAQEIVPEIEARSSAGEGSVRDLRWGEHFQLYQNGDHILCRTNAPLFKEAMRLLLYGNNVCILGKDLGKQLMKIVKEIDKENGAIDSKAIETYYEDKSWTIPEKYEHKRRALRDKCDVLYYIVGEDCMTVKEVQETIDSILYDKPPSVACITLSTVHKSKGLEANRIFIIRPDLIPFPYAKREEEIVQEHNLHYVAITRAKHELYYVWEEQG